MITAQHRPDDPRTDTEIYADLLDLCEVAERAGFDAAWLSEHHFVDDGYMPSLLPVAAAAAARTTRLRIGTGVLLAPLHDPLHIAEDAATVDVISAGRLVLGLGAGYREEEFAGFGVAHEGLGDVLDRTLAIVRQAWAGEPVDAHGAPVRVTPRPHTPAGPPIWLGARTRAGIRRTARAADGLIAARVTPDEFRAQVAVLDEQAAAVGRDPRELTVSVHCPVLAWPGDGGWDLLEPQLWYSEWKYKDMVGEPYGLRAGATDGPPSLSPGARQAIRPQALVGPAEVVAERIAAYRDAAGAHPFHFTARLYWPGLDHARQREVVQYFGAEVIPLLREPAAAGASR